MALRELSIRNFAIIKQLETEFDDGLTIITGETGAGKSILLGALNLVMGARAEVDMIRHNEEQADVTALFEVKDLKKVQGWLADNDFGLQDKYCRIRRVIRKDKPTKCYINDQATSLNNLKELGQQLIDLHGQHEHQSLLRKSTQRTTLDDIASHSDDLSNLSLLANQISSLQAQLDSLLQNNTDNTSRIELLNFQLSELNEASVSDNEFKQLEQEHARLDNARNLIDGITEAMDALFDNDVGNLTSSLGKSALSLESLAEFEPNLKTASTLLNSSLAQIEESKSSLDSALANIDVDPERLLEVEQRMDTIITLARKHRCTEAELTGKHQFLQTELDGLQNVDAAPEEIEAKLSTLKSNYLKLAGLISNRRQSVAKQLSESITAQMQDLGMQGGKLQISVEPMQEPYNYSENGIDNIDYLVSTNQGSPLKPLNKTASGGELSRISLAIQVITSAKSNTPSLIFDEVDVGVGGAVAEIVGNRLRSLGNNAQVICITHLPQVASQGNQHLFIDKMTENNETFSSLTPLNDEQRIDEIARMLGGADITARTKAHAKEMLRGVTL